MATVDCPQGDKGLCEVPDTTAVIKGGAISIHSRSELEEMHGPLNLDPDKLTEINLDMTPTQLSDALQYSSMATEPQPELVTAIRSNAPEGTGVVVNCSCGHYYIAELP